MRSAYLAIISAFLAVAIQHTATGEEDLTLSQLNIGGILRQGGFVRGYAPEGMEIGFKGNKVPTTSSGHFIIGIDRDAPESFEITISDNETIQPMTLSIAKRRYREGQVITGLKRRGATPESEPLGHDDLFPSDSDPDFSRSGITPSASLSRNEQAQKKLEALASRADMNGFMEDWISPLGTTYPVSSPWGAARIVRGNKRIHYGVDIAAPLGTGIRAPASGIVTLAATDYYYEGGVVFIDHGLGLTSIYLHMSDVDVAKGDIVEPGALLGKVGAEGRASGPHLCWRLYWNGRQVKIDPQGF